MRHNVILQYSDGTFESTWTFYIGLRSSGLCFHGSVERFPATQVVHWGKGYYRIDPVRQIYSIKYNSMTRSTQ